MDDTRLQAAEEHIAHLSRAQDELSQVVAEQAQAIEVLERGLAQLQARVREGGDTGGAPPADARPPHW